MEEDETQNLQEDMDLDYPWLFALAKACPDKDLQSMPDHHVETLYRAYLKSKSQTNNAQSSLSSSNPHLGVHM